MKSLTPAFYEKLSDICADIGQVCLATLVIPFLTNNKNNNFIIIGSCLALIFWLLSLWVSQVNKLKEKK